MTTDTLTLDLINVEAGANLLRSLGIALDDPDAPAKIAERRQSLGPDRWRTLLHDARAPVERRHAEQAAAAEAERKRTAWAPFEQQAAGIVKASGEVDTALTMLAAALREVRTKIAAAREAFPGDPSVSNLFDIAALNRRVEQAAVRSVNGAAVESFGATARSALALLEKVRAAARAT